jgi:hypothetical protein
MNRAGAASGTALSHETLPHNRRTIMNDYAGRSHDERVAQRKREKQRAQEPPGGDMAVHGTGPDAQHSCGELSERGKDVWRTGAGLDGGGRTDGKR